MIERKVSWWRKVLDFALGGIRSGFGLFSHNARVEAEPAMGATLEVFAVEVENPEVEELELKQTSPQTEAVSSEVKRAAEAAPAELVSHVDENKPAVRPTEEAKAEPGIPAAQEPEVSAEMIVTESPINVQADEEAERARLDAEDTFDEAERRMSTDLAREGAGKALRTYELREAAIRKSEAASHGE